MAFFDIVIDVSDNNGDIDWQAVYSDGIRIAFVKAMEGSSGHYPTWGAQSAGARKAGIAVIPYWFLRPLPFVSAAATRFADAVELTKGMPFMLDVEGRASQTATATQVEKVGAALSAIAGRSPILYAGIPGSTPFKLTSVMNGWERFVPRYPIQDARSWDDIPLHIKNNGAHLWRTVGPLPRFMQYTAWGRVSGISGDVDRSVVMAESVEAAVAWCNGTG